MVVLVVLVLGGGVYIKTSIFEIQFSCCPAISCIKLLFRFPVGSGGATTGALGPALFVFTSAAVVLIASKLR